MVINKKEFRMKRLLMLLLAIFIALPITAQEKDSKSDGQVVEIPLGNIEKLHEIAKNAADINERIKAIQSLAKFKRSESVQVLIDVLEEPFRQQYAFNDKQFQDNWKVRVEAAKAMRAYEGDKEVASKVYRPLTRVMVYDPEERVKGEAALTLGVIGRAADPEVKERIVEQLIVKLNHTPVHKNLLALMLVKALGRLGHPKALVPLIAVTQKGYLRVVKEEAKKSIEALSS